MMDCELLLWLIEIVGEYSEQHGDSLTEEESRKLFRLYLDLVLRKHEYGCGA